ncbi:MULTISPECIES: hypothetical protein [Mesonia]|uniref:Uncharacterized protein n=1 Tax=Mesonia oceanica TaxID=2687242 RepID=A0AC61YC86_9FLAO|nr:MULTISPECIES: hypothetical protein [Mesonia]MAN26981.1 hypothetical protein [Mesonia sp.]VVV01890.1 hypothetical protein FVB9532_03184 [Mesonia oceanica]|tara:strand:+ start:48151 stop:49296 length:1146 start_codon:yes stop_codon:yes gene_type:complete
MKELYTDFIEKLQKLYGDFNKDTKRFYKASNSKISRDLGYSDAQFSRLINQTATEGEYQRALLNINRILKIEELEKLQAKIPQEQKAVKPTFSKLNWLWPLSLFLLILIIGYILWKPSSSIIEKEVIKEVPADYTLEWAFNTKFVNPYTKLDELPNDCNYPCYKFQGIWHLKNPYKIPLYMESRGFHYQAVEVRMYARCMKEKSSSGDLLEGLEYQKHEIWYDKNEQPIDSFINTFSGLKSSYKDLDLSKNPNFVKIAEIHTFFRNEFTISDSLYRTGKVIGRNMEMVPDEIIRQKLSDDQIEIIRQKLSAISNKGLEDFSRPVSCLPSPLPAKNFNLIKEKDSLVFKCQLMTNKIPIDYTKIYILENQYIKTNCRTFLEE